MAATADTEPSLLIRLGRVLAQALVAGLVFALVNLPFGTEDIVSRGVTFGAIMGVLFLGHALWGRRKARLGG